MYMTRQEIIKKYDGQWVFMINCLDGDNGETIGGEVVIHSEDRDKVLRDMEKYDYEESATLITYVGKIPEGIHILL